ncbi:MAG: pilus assembly protein TadG-related protein [Novosphingobium sp.]
MSDYRTDARFRTPNARALTVRRMVAGLARLIADKSGVTLATMAMMMPLLIGFSGLALDVGVWQVNKRNLQGAADQAAFSAAIAYSKGASVAASQTQAKAVMAEHGFVDGTSGLSITVSNPASSGNYMTNTRAWEVTATNAQSLYFSGIFMSSAPSVAVRSVALSGSTVTTPPTTETQAGKGCVLTLDTTASYATEITNNGSSSNVNCEIYTNSNSSSALGCYNNCTVRGDTFTVGGLFNNGTMTGINKTRQTAIADPYASLSTPTAATMGSCVTSTVIRSLATASRTIGPGRYCGGINFTGSGKTLVMTAGTYYVESIFNVGTGATLNATAGVTIVIVGNYCLGDTNNTCQHPDEGIGNVANINITAPTTGTYAGVAMHFSSTTYRQHAFANNAYLHIQGVLYAPKQKLAFNNNSTFDNTKCTKVISAKVTINNNGNMSASCDGTGVKSIGDKVTVTPGTSSTTNSSMVE